MSDCWADCLGDCSDKVSREHIVSKGLFDTQGIYVQGFQWCMNEPKPIAVEGFTAKILCSKHNSELSRVDQAGIETANVFREAFRLSDVREKMRPRIWARKKFRIDGYQLERWFLKTLINVACRGDRPLGSRAEYPGKPTQELVEIAFGLKQFSQKAGLYLMADIGEMPPRGDLFRIITALQDDKHLAGARFQFQGIRYLLCLDSTGARRGLRFMGRDGKAYEPSNLLFHPAKVNFDVAGRPSHTIEFSW